MQKKRERSARVIGLILFISLVLSALYALVRLIISSGQETADYLLMLTQCVLGIVVMLLPSLIEKRFRLTIPNIMIVLYYIFLYCAIFLGEVFSFYYRIPHWDTILHTFSGAMLGALGFILVSLLNESERVRVHLSPFFVALFAFCFALAVGAVWEIYEFACDGLMGMNMQKFAAEGGEAFVGREALIDTMEDLICDALAALVVSAFGYISIRRKRKETDEIADRIAAE